MQSGQAQRPAAALRPDRALAGERRQVTALFYDIVNSTTFLNAMDPEDFAQLQRQIHDEAAVTIARHSGHLDRIFGDGGCAYFGYPDADEDAAGNAVGAALDLVERCKSLAQTPALALRVRVGVATGLVVISHPEQPGLSGQDEFVGIAPTLAARLQSEAEPDSVAVADSTYRLTRFGFAFQALGQRVLKGFAEPVLVWRPVSRHAWGDRFSTTRNPDTPLSGRLHELDLCRQRWAQARTGRGQVVYLLGEPGIGKSRLVSELRREAQDWGFDARVFQCEPRGNARPLHPFVDSLRREIFGATSPDGNDLDALESYLASQNLHVGSSTIQTIAFLIGSGPGREGVGMELADLSSEELRRRALTATVEVVSGWALKRPQLIVIEDSHWADTLTEALLTQLAEGIAHLPVFLVVTSRQEPRSDFRGHPHIHLLALPRLDLAEIPTLLESIWQPVPKGLARFVHKKSEGVPLFAEELARLLRERFGTGVSTERDWERSLKESGVATLQDLLSARLAALGRVRYVAQVASAIGRGFSVDVLSHLIEMGGSSPSLDEAVAALVAQGIIRPRKLGEGPIFSFRHVLMHEVAYASLLKAERHRLHNRIVDLVGSGDVAPPSDDLMAWHCEQAGRSSQAAGYAIRAAEACAARWALDEANKLLATAEEQLRLAAAVSDADDLMLRLLTVRGSVAMALFGKGSTEARSVYEQGVRLCRQKGVGERERWLPLYWGWWFTAPDHFVGTKRAEVILDQLDKVGDPEVRLQALHCGWAANFHAGRHEQSLQCIEHGLTLYDPDRAVASRARYGGHDAKVCGLGERALLEWLLDRPEAARQSMAAAIGCAESIEHLGSLCHALDIALTLYGWEHDHATVAQLADRLGRIADLHDLPNAAAKSKIFSGWARAFDGDLSGGLVKLNHGLDLQKAIGTDEDMPIYAGMAAELLARLGREAAASQLLDEALEQAERAGNLFWVPELYRRRASLRRNGGEDLKSPDLDRALELARKQGAKALVRRITSDHAGMGLSSGRAH